MLPSLIAKILGPIIRLLKLRSLYIIKTSKRCPGQVVQLVRTSSHVPKGGRFASSQGTNLSAGLISRQGEYRRQPMDISLSPFLFCLCVSPSSLKSIILKRNLKKETQIAGGYFLNLLKIHSTGNNALDSSHQHKTDYWLRI